LQVIIETSKKHCFFNYKIIASIYINAKKTIAEGRRVPIVHAVDNPTANEIYEVCKHLGFTCELEKDKAYSRDYMQRGRVRVLMKNEKGERIHNEIKNKQQLLSQLSTLIPKLTSRSKKPEISQTVTGNAKKKGKGKNAK